LPKYPSLPKLYHLPHKDSRQNASNIRTISHLLPLIHRRGRYLFRQSTKTLKLLIGTGLDQYEMNAVVATLYFILTNSVMFQVADATLNKELVDLGLPKGRTILIEKMWKALLRYLRQTGKSSLKLA
jgi:hypothetical protein